MARFTGDEHFLQRARAVRIDHQINRVRNEIDDHRIYVDPSRFSSWLEDEIMIDQSTGFKLKCIKELKYLGYFLQDKGELSVEYHAKARVIKSNKYVEEEQLRWICSNYKCNFKARRTYFINKVMAKLF